MSEKRLYIRSNFFFYYQRSFLKTMEFGLGCIVTGALHESDTPDYPVNGQSINTYIIT